MRVIGMSEIDLNGVLFVNFPAWSPLAESRDSLEMLIAEAWEEDYADAGGADGGEDGEDGRLEMAITPYWVWRALCVKARHETAGMTREERRAEIVAWREERRKRLAEKGIKRAAGASVAGGGHGA